MQRIDISTLGLCEKYIVGEAGNVGLSSNLGMLLGTQIFSSSLSTATTWPHWVINKNPIDIQGQRIRQHLHVLWRQHTSACCHSESCLMFPLRLLTKPGMEFKFLGAGPLLVTDLKGVLTPQASCQSMIQMLLCYKNKHMQCCLLGDGTWLLIYMP